MAKAMDKITAVVKVERNRMIISFSNGNRDQENSIGLGEADERLKDYERVCRSKR